MKILTGKYVEADLGQISTLSNFLMQYLGLAHLVLLWSEVILTTDPAKLHYSLKHNVTKTK